MILIMPMHKLYFIFLIIIYHLSILIQFIAFRLIFLFPINLIY